MPRPPAIELIVRGALRHRDNLLICRNRKHGHIFLPGGHIEHGEPARLALEREMLEELGQPLRAGRFLGVCESAFHDPREHTRKQPPRAQRKPDAHPAAPTTHEINLVFDLTAPPGIALDTIVSQERKIEFLWLPLNRLVGDSPEHHLLPHGIVALLDASRRGDGLVTAM